MPGTVQGPGSEAVKQDADEVLEHSDRLTGMCRRRRQALTCTHWPKWLSYEFTWNRAQVMGIQGGDRLLGREAGCGQAALGRGSTLASGSGGVLEERLLLAEEAT